jgi:YidC/Oxa1 family membrane protein insertase
MDEQRQEAYQNRPLRPTLSRRQRAALFKREVTTYLTFFGRRGRPWRELVFYAAQAQYISFYEGLLPELGQRGAKIGYITSDHDDPILSTHPDYLVPFYFDALFPFVLPFLDAKVVVMTMPDLNQFHVRRSIFETNHVYLFHSLMSTHMGFRPGALDHFDTILCTGPHHKEEIQRTEKLYSLKPKCLLESGYYRLEKIYADHQHYRQTSDAEGVTTPCVLIAPSGHDTNIVSTCARELLATVLDAGFDVVFRPHPMTIYRRPEQLRPLLEEFGIHENFSLDVETVSEESLHRADVLISDWSGVALEYAFGTERPVLFIDLPRRQQNPEYERVGIPAIEVFLRDKIGRIVRLDEISQIDHIIREVLGQRERYREEIIRLRPRYVYNFGNSSKIAADLIMKIYDGTVCSSL